MTIPYAPVQASLADQRTQQQAMETENTLGALLSQRNKAALEGQAMQQKIAAANQLNQQNPGQGVQVEGVGIKPDMMQYRGAMLDVQQQKADALSNRVQNQQEQTYTKRSESFAAAAADLANLEGMTGQHNPGGGGVITDPNAKLLSGGKLMNKVGDEGIGMAEFLGVVPKGAAEERKTIARLQNNAKALQFGLGGGPEAIKLEKNSMGNMVSSDPNLQAEGIRQYAAALKNRFNASMASVPPELKQKIMDSNPQLAILAKIHEDHPMQQPGMQAPVSTTGGSASPAAGDQMNMVMQRIQQLEAKKAKASGGVPQGQ